MPDAVSLASAPGVSTSLVRDVGPSPRLLELKLEPRARLNVDSLVQELRSGTPGILVGRTGSAILINPALVMEGDEAVIARRLAQLLG